MIKTSSCRNLFLVVLLMFIATGFSQRKKIKYINSPLMQPSYLQKGDTVQILAPAGIIKDFDAIDNAVQLLEDWGLHVKIGKNVSQQNHHFSGTDEQRTEDLQNALDDPEIKAIWCARGGYGTVRIIDNIDFTKFRKNPKWIIGFSDVTILHNEVHNLGIETVHALMPSTIKKDNEDQKKALKSLKDALFGEKLIYRFSESDYNKEGEAKGQLVGGNLSILYSVLGSKSSIKTGGKILFIEDVGEYIYHIDRMLVNLKRNGYFDNCYGLIVGGISNVRENDQEFGKAVEEVILDNVKEYDFPVSFDFPSGHIDDNRTLILGREVSLKVKGKKAVLKFSKSQHTTQSEPEEILKSVKKENSITGL